MLNLLNVRRMSAAEGYMTFMRRNIGGRTFRRGLLAADFYAPGLLSAGTFRRRTFRRREGQLQQISVFAFSLNLKKHCELELV